MVSAAACRGLNRLRPSLIAFALVVGTYINARYNAFTVTMTPTAQPQDPEGYAL